MQEGQNVGFFVNATMTLTHSNGTLVSAHLPITLDPINAALDLDGTLIPVDRFDCETVGWTSPVPLRSDYLVDEETGAKYSLYSTIFTGINTLQFQVSKPSGATP
jgi:hypothetical protein